MTTAATAAISEILVNSLQAFAEAANLSEFFIAIVIVAIVGNAAEHGGAVVIARRGKMKLATEIAISSSAQVGLLVIPVVTLASFAFAHPLALAFRPIELVAMGAAALFVGFCAASVLIALLPLGFVLVFVTSQGIRSLNVAFFESSSHLAAIEIVALWVRTVVLL